MNRNGMPDSEKAALKSETSLRLLIENLKDVAIVTLELDGCLASWNSGAEHILGYAESEILGQSISVIFTPEDRAIGADVAELQTARREGRANDERWHLRKNGTRFYASGILTLLCDDYGIPYGFAKIMRDLTERKQAETDLYQAAQELEQRSRIFEVTLSTIIDFVYIFDTNGRFIYANQALATLLGMMPQDMIGKNFFELPYPPDVAAHLQQQIQWVIDTNQVLIDETPYISPAGLHGDYEYIFTPVQGPDGAVELVAGSTRDITARKHAEITLQVSEEKTRQILESINDAFFAVDQDWCFTYLNTQAGIVLERSPGDLLGKNIWMEFPELAGSEFERVYRRVGDEKIASSTIAFDAGHNRWHEVHTYPAPNGITVYLRDVTEQVRAKEALQIAYASLESRVQERTAQLKATDEARRDLIQKMVTTQEEERTRIARELHDQTAHQLTSLIFGLNNLKKRRMSATTRQETDELISLTRTLMDEIHTIAQILRPPLLDVFGLESALEDHGHKWSVQSRISIQVEFIGFEGRRLPSELEIAIYRIVQEALTNILRHGLGAKHVSISVVWQADVVTTTIEDDGPGFDVAAMLSLSPEKRRLGLLGMQERAMLLGGILTVESHIGTGTVIRLQLLAPLLSRVS